MQMKMGGKSREIELVVGGGDEERAERMSIRSSRRHVFEDIEVKDDIIEANGRSLEGEEEAARASICIPPKNALLLMRCRSDPIKMAALANGGCWDAHAAPKYENEDIEKENHGEESADFGEQEEVRGLCEGKEKIFVVKEAEVDEVFEQDVAVSVKPNEEQEIQNEAEANLEMEVGDHGCVEELYEEELVISSEEKQQAIKANEEALVEEEKEDVESNMSSFEALLDQENTEHYEDCPIQVKEEVEESPTCHISSSAQSDEEAIDRNAVTSVPEEAAIEKEKEEETEESTTSEKDTTFANNDTQNPVTAQLKPKPGRTHQEDEKEEQKAIQPTKSEAGNPENQELVISNQETKKEKESPALPECLLLMMCEPKLSMEVSKETWVRSTDFIRRLPERPRKPAKTTIISGCDHNPVKRRPSIDSKPKPRVPAPPTKKNDLQPPRSSCSLPAASMATIIEQKLGNAGGTSRLR
ncbi:hypothetical protein Pfo_022746 [Paulownia fortunei]|nr:hypothetical protein Pfo_022746 [Paulownia fortunei]